MRCKYNDYFNTSVKKSLDLLGQIKNPNDMKAIRDLISGYFAKKAEDAIDALWDQGKITSETVENWKHEHIRSHVGL